MLFSPLLYMNFTGSFAVVTDGGIAFAPFFERLLGTFGNADGGNLLILPIS